ncbi:L-2-amino-thiazoline-4-carboxylic acid hydrolase [Mucilaginibacter sp. UYCu711]|uniref:L-2-amino-thiazoline-4-carboxylic acid hydrolase n=1 Tax=Mucilaginibacter sp. UYCu711 TaxID=3156339 RepID=UPI003D1C7B5B
MKNLLLYWFKLQAAKSAKIELIKLYDIETVKQILSSYWQRYQELKPEVPVMPTLGGYVTVHLAALSTAFYNELTAKGQNEEATAKIFYDIAWKVYIKMGKLSWWLAGLRNRKVYGRLLKTTQLFRAFPFNSPSYKWQDIKTGDNVVGFDCLKCPVAEYFQSKGLSKFCTQTWCSLDYPLAQLWHAKLERTGSIAGGADKCDFRWTAENPLRSETLTPNIH